MEGIARCAASLRHALLVRPGTGRGPGPVEITSIPKGIKIGYAVFMDHVRTPDLLRAHSAQLFNWTIEGRLKVHICGIYALADAARAHADMESRKTTGKLLLIS